MPGVTETVIFVSGGQDGFTVKLSGHGQESFYRRIVLCENFLRQSAALRGFAEESKLRISCGSPFMAGALCISQSAGRQK